MTNTTTTANAPKSGKSKWPILGIVLVSLVALGVGGYFLVDKLYQDKVAKEVATLFDQQEKIVFMDELLVIDLHKNYQLTPAGWLRARLAFNVDIGIEGDIKTFPLIAEIEKEQINAKLDLDKLDGDIRQVIEPYWGKGADPITLTSKLGTNQYQIHIRRSNGYYRLEDGERIRTGDGLIELGFEHSSPEKMNSHISMHLSSLILEDQLEQISIEGFTLALKDQGIRLSDRDKAELVALVSDDPAANFLLKQDYFPF